MNITILKTISSQIITFSVLFSAKVSHTWPSPSVISWDIGDGAFLDHFGLASYKKAKGLTDAVERPCQFHIVKLNLLLNSKNATNGNETYERFSFFFSVHLSVCLPVDVMILYKEPFGFEGTMVIIVLAFVPFLVIFHLFSCISGSYLTL